MSYLREGEYIPEVPDAVIKELSKQIKPVARFAEGVVGLFVDPRGRLFYIKVVSLKDNYLLNPVPVEEANVAKLMDIKVYCTAARSFSFSARVGEILAQIPEELQEEAVAFEILRHPERPTDFWENEEAIKAFDDGYCIALVRLYRAGEAKDHGS